MLERAVCALLLGKQQEARDKLVDAPLSNARLAEIAVEAAKQQMMRDKRKRVAEGGGREEQGGKAHAHQLGARDSAFVVVVSTVKIVHSAYFVAQCRDLSPTQLNHSVSTGRLMPCHIRCSHGCAP